MIILKEHNVKPYAQLCEMLAIHQKCAYIAATGTGKSYVVGKYIEDHDLVDKTLVLVPNMAIKDGWLKLIPGLEILTYQALCRSRYDVSGKELIVCDEMHHLGGDDWGRVYQEVIQGFRGKLIGITATPIRFLDKSRNMVDEFFDGNSIEGLDLPGAISAGILPSFEYITALYNLPSRIPKKDKINETTEKLFSRLDFMKSEYSFQNILRKHLDAGNHKVAVFVNKISGIDEVFQLCRKVYPNASHFVIHSAKKETVNKKILDSFKASEGMAFIYTVDMFNEGVHIEGIDTVIMFRKTESPNIYLQQLGRALSTDMAGHKVKIFDFVANHKNLKAVRGGSGTVITWIRTGITNPEKQIVVRDYAMEELEVLDRLKKVMCGFWTADEERILREYYDEGNGLETVMKMLPHRKKKSIINRASDLRLSKHRDLRERGVYDAVRELYGTEDGLEKFKERFPDVKPSNYSTIARALGIAVKKEIPKWTDEEIEKLKEMSEQGVSVKEQSDILGKDYMCVVDKRRHIGISNKNHRWTKEEDEILRNNQNLTAGEIQSRYLPYIGTTTICKRRKRLGVAYSTIWTDEKKERFRKIYREQGAEGIRKSKEFSGMSDEWIRKKAVLLGVRGRTIYRFTEDEDAVICNYMHDHDSSAETFKQLEELLPNHPEKSIATRWRTVLRKKEAEANGTDTENTGTAVPTDTKAEA